MCSLALFAGYGFSQTISAARPNSDHQPRVPLSTEFCTTPAVLDETCVQNEVAAGAVVRVAAGTYVASHTIVLDQSNLLIEFEPGVVWNFEPKGVISRANNNDRAFLIHNDDGFSGPLPIVGSIAVGSKSFISGRRLSPSDVKNGDWLFVQETDPWLREITAIDWVQVESVSNGACGYRCLVTVQRPFRMRFLNNHDPSTLSFNRIVNYVHDVGMKCNGAIIQSSQKKIGTPGISIGVVRGAGIDGCVVAMANGQALYSYRSSNLILRDNRVIRSGSAASEFAATVDVSLEGNSFGSEGMSNPDTPEVDSAALSIDYGTAFFTVIGNRFLSGSDIMVEILYGVHDGVISGNVWSWTGTTSLSVGQAVSAIGAKRVLLTGNVMDGGVAGGGNTGISFSSFQAAKKGSRTIASEGNLISNNIINNYANRYGPLLAGDSYVDFAGKNKFSSLSSPADGSLIYCSDCTVAEPPLCRNVTDVEACACKGGGSGALAKRINGAWLCN